MPNGDCCGPVPFTDQSQVSLNPGSPVAGSSSVSRAGPDGAVEALSDALGDALGLSLGDALSVGVADGVLLLGGSLAGGAVVGESLPHPVARVSRPATARDASRREG